MRRPLTVDASWQLIHEVLGRYAPQRLDNLRPPATADQLEHLEADLGRVLPQDLKASLLIHNGEDWEDWGILSRAWNLLSIEQIKIHHEQLIYNHFSPEIKLFKKQLDEQFGASEFIFPDLPGFYTRVRRTEYSPEWIPFAYSGGGNYYLVDLAPESRGVLGQCLRWIRALGPDQITNPSYQAFLSNVANKMEGYYRKKRGL